MLPFVPPFVPPLVESGLVGRLISTLVGTVESGTCRVGAGTHHGTLLRIRGLAIRDISLDACRQSDWARPCASPLGACTPIRTAPRVMAAWNTSTATDGALIMVPAAAAAAAGTGSARMGQAVASFGEMGVVASLQATMSAAGWTGRPTSTFASLCVLALPRSGANGLRYGAWAFWRGFLWVGIGSGAERGGCTKGSGGIGIFA
jgi:hypothetical protein